MTPARSLHNECHSVLVRAFPQSAPLLYIHWPATLPRSLFPATCFPLLLSLTSSSSPIVIRQTLFIFTLLSCLLLKPFIHITPSASAAASLLQRRPLTLFWPANASRPIPRATMATPVERDLIATRVSPRQANPVRFYIMGSIGRDLGSSRDTR